MKLRIAALLALLFSAISACAATATFWQFPDTGGLIGTEVLPLSFPQGGGVYQTRKTTVNSIATFVEADLLGKANTWPLGQIWSSQSTFSVAPVFASLTGYCQAHGAGVPITCAATIPMSAIIGPLPAAQVPAPTASTLGGVQSATAPTHQVMTGITTAGVPIFAQLNLSDLTGSTSFSSIGGFIAAGQIPNGIITLGMQANLAANSLVGNNTGSPATPVPVAMTAALDIISSTPGSVLYRGASAWLALAPGSLGQTLTMGTSYPQWNTGSLGAAPVLLATLTPTSGTTVSATGLASFNEYYITFKNVIVSNTSSQLDILFSINNGGAYTDPFLTLGTGAANSFYGFVDITGVATDIMSFSPCVRDVNATGAGCSSSGPVPTAYLATTGQINALRISSSSGTFVSGTIKIYGR